jgi:hypothetical protein
MIFHFFQLCTSRRSLGLGLYGPGLSYDDSCLTLVSLCLVLLYYSFILLNFGQQLLLAEGLTGGQNPGRLPPPPPSPRLLGPPPRNTSFVSTDD